MLRISVGAVVLLASLGACGDDETGGAPVNPKPRWACKSSATRCVCDIIEGDLVLATGEQEVETCGVAAISSGLGICWQGDKVCTCISYECGANRVSGACGCRADHWTTDPEDTPVDACEDYPSCCVSPDSELCFCGPAACNSGGEEVESCSAETAAPILDQRDPTRIRVDVCSEPPGF